MPVYIYSARDEEGKVTRGELEAPHEAAALSQLQAKGLYVTEIISSVSKDQSGFRRTGPKRHPRISADDMLFFIQQTSNLITAGLPLIRAVELIREQTESQKLYKALQEMIQNVREGSSLRNAMGRHPQIFPDFWLSLIEAGEVSGTLPQVLSQIAKNVAAEKRLKSKIASALIYPSILIFASIAAIIAMMVFVIPTFAKVFASFNAKLPSLTQGVLDVSNFMRSYILFILLGLGALGYGFKVYRATPKGRRAIEGLVLHMPVVGPVAKDIIHARVCLILSMLIRSGISFIKTVEICARVSGNVFYETALNNIKLDIQTGKSFASCLKDNPLFSTMLVGLATVGEEGGSLPEMIDTAGAYHENKVDLFASRIGVLIEPVIMLVVGSIIGVLVIAMFLPIINLSNAVKGS